MNKKLTYNEWVKYIHDYQLNKYKQMDKDEFNKQLSEMLGDKHIHISDTKKVKVMQRSVYHKYAEVEVEVPNDIKDDDMQSWLVENDHLYNDEMDDKLSKAKYEFGFGCEYTGMNEENNASEWRFEIVGENYGGHL